MELFKRLIDIIYPPRCKVCGEFLGRDGLGGTARALSFCRSCYADIREIPHPRCPVCSRPFASEVKEDHLCEECIKKAPFYNAIIAPYLYEGALMTAVHRLKYGAKSSLADSLGPLLARFAETNVHDPGEFLTIPVPLHPKKLRERGFNQSLLLARHVARHLRTELDFLSLRRVKYRLPQTGLGKEERRKNVFRAFRMERPGVVKGKSVLLVDDVATTGSTLNECARVLVHAGCERVICLVLARTGAF